MDGQVQNLPSGLSKNNDVRRADGSAGQDDRAFVAKCSINNARVSNGDGSGRCFKRQDLSEVQDDANGFRSCGDRHTRSVYS